MFRHRAYKIEVDKRSLIFIPTLGKVFETTTADSSKVPDYVESQEEPNLPQQDNFVDGFTSATLLVTTGCNLRCIYCYESAGEIGRKATFMSEELAFRTVDRLIENARIARKRARLYFFGGEATIALPLIKKIVAYARTQAVACKTLPPKMFMTTNAVVRQETADWVIENLDGLTVSLDGTREIHDSQRSGSFEKVVATLDQWFASAPEKLQIRMTVTELGAVKLPEAVEFIAGRYPGVKIFAEPVTAIGRATASSVKAPDHDSFFAKLLEAIQIARRHGSILRTGVLREPNFGNDFCGVSRGSVIVRPDGVLATCPRTALSEDNISRDFFRLGRIDTQTGEIVLDEAQRKRTSLLKVFSVSECDECFARVSCLGDCPASKAAVLGQSFWNLPSHRCEAIKRFYAKYLLWLLDTKQPVGSDLDQEV